jgi:Protein of unknown function (DUF2817)
MPVAEYFNPDYARARERFHAAAGSAGAVLESHVLPDHRGPEGEALAIDVAHLGAQDADRGLLIISGTHGVEGFCGSGCQIGFLRDRLYEALPASACVTLVHALNPYGFAWLRRVNEAGVDLNRNFIDFSQPLPSSEAYEALHELLVPADWTGPGRREADLALGAFARQRGWRTLQTAVTSGQYTRPTGLFYGGTQTSWSALTLRKILQQRLGSLQRVAVLDLHTGLGPAGYGEPIVIARQAADFERARRWYGPEVRDLAAGESVSVPLVGTVPQGIDAALPNAEVTSVGLEFGTIPEMEVLTALRADHWLHTHGQADATLRAAIKQQMRQAFYIDSPAWQAAVYGRTADFVYRACRGLA